MGPFSVTDQTGQISTPAEQKHDTDLSRSTYDNQKLNFSLTGTYDLPLVVAVHPSNNERYSIAKMKAIKEIDSK